MVQLHSHGALRGTVTPATPTPSTPPLLPLSAPLHRKFLAPGTSALAAPAADAHRSQPSQPASERAASEQPTAAAASQRAAAAAFDILAPDPSSPSVSPLHPSSHHLPNTIEKRTSPPIHGRLIATTDVLSSRPAAVAWRQ